MPRSSTSNGAIAYTDSQRLGSPLLEDSAPPLRRLPSAPSSRSASGAKALRRFRKVIVAQMARMRAERAANVNPPALSAAREYMRYYLPKTSDGKLLSLRWIGTWKVTMAPNLWGVFRSCELGELERDLEREQ